jgi:hypothetical protein
MKGRAIPTHREHLSRGSLVFQIVRLIAKTGRHGSQATPRNR